MNTIYYNGEIITMKNEKDIYNAIVITDGKVEFVGNTEDAMKLKKDHRVVDLDGKTMLPGFIDPHSHFTFAALLSEFISIAPPPVGVCKSIEDIKEHVKKEIKRRHIKKGKPVIALSYDNALFPEDRNLTRHDLDEISTEHPVIAAHQSMHVGCVNSYMLEKEGITSDSVDPAGGAIVKDPNTNEPTGLLEEKAFEEVIFKYVKPNLLKLKQMFKNGTKLYAGNGITTAQEGAVVGPFLMLLKLASTFGWLDLDIVGYYRCTELEHFTELDKHMKKHKEYKKHFRLGGAKFFLDGSPQAKTAWLSQPYHVVPEGYDASYNGYPTYEDDNFVRSIYEEALKRDYQILTHTNGDEASEQLIREYQNAQVATNNYKDLRPVMIHAQTVRTDQLERMKEMNMIPSFFHDHTFYWGDWHLDSVLGPDRGRRISPLKEALEMGIPFNMHQDTPVVPPWMMLTIWGAVNRKTRSGRTIGEEYRLTPFEAIKAITVNAAYAYFEEDIKGTLEPGKYADIVVLEENPLTCDPDHIKDIQVVKTIKEGKVIYRR